MKQDIKRLFDPSSLAVIGASNIPGKWGFGLMFNILTGGYRGKIYPVNPSEKNILGFKTYSSVNELPEPVDLALITIPAERAIECVKECGKKGIRWAVVISSDFAEAGDEGRERQERLVRAGEEYGVKIIGPNTMGIYSSSSSLHALGSPFQAKKGKIALISQSGNIGVQIMGLGERIGLGFSRFFGTGNEAMLRLHHFVEMLLDDGETEIIAIYVEGIRDGRRFYDVLRRASLKKPVIILKSATTSAGARAALSHTGAMATDKFITESAIRQSGAVRVNTTEEMLDVLSGFSLLPVPEGRNVCIITMGGGWGVVASEACEKEGLFLPPLPEEARKHLDEMLPHFWSKGNPVDLVGSLRRSVQLKILSYLSEFDEFNSFIIMGYLTERFFRGFHAYKRRMKMLLTFFANYTKEALSLPFLFIKGTRKGVKEVMDRRRKTSGFDVRERKLWKDIHVIELMKKINSEKKKPVIAVSGSPEVSLEIQRKHSIPVASYPEKAAFILSKLAHYGEALKRLKNGELPRVRMPEREMNEFLEGKTKLDEYETREFLRKAGIPVVEEFLVRSEEEAIKAARKIGFPLVMKPVSPDILHKTELGVVWTGIKSEEEVLMAFRSIRETVQKKLPEVFLRGISVQKMLRGGIELIVGIAEDDVFGKIILFGSGGIATETYKDISVRIPPLNLEEIREMVNEPLISKAWKNGFRGKKFTSQGVERIVGILSEISVKFPRIKELEVNPLILTPEGEWAVDALCILKEK